MLFALSTHAVGACCCWPSRAGAAEPPARSIAIFALFAQLVATCYVQSVWIDLSRTFYFETHARRRLLGDAARRLQLRPAARHRRQPDPAAWPIRRSTARGCARPGSAWRELPRFRILQRVDLLLQMLYLVLTVLCIFYLIVITIDWYDGVIRLSDTFFRQIAIDGRYRDFPIWSFVIPSIVLMAWKIMTVLRKEKVARHERFMRALSFGRLLGYDGSRGYVRMDQVVQPDAAGPAGDRAVRRC